MTYLYQVFHNDSIIPCVIFGMLYVVLLAIKKIFFPETQNEKKIFNLETVHVCKNNDIKEHKSHGYCSKCYCHNPLANIILEKVLNDNHLSSSYQSEKPVGREREAFVFHGGTIRPFIKGDTESIVEAIGIENGLVLAVGTLEEVQSAMSQIDYEQVELDANACLIPGFIEPHVHIISSVMAHDWINVGPFDQQNLRAVYDTNWLSDVLSKAREESDFIIGFGLDPSLMPFETEEGPGKLNILQRFDPKIMDGFISDVPVLILSASMHSIYVNTVALQKIYEKHESVRNTYDTFEKFNDHVTKAGGLQELDEMSWTIAIMPIGIISDIGLKSFSNLSDYYRDAHSKGVTMMYDAGMTTSILDLLKLYDDVYPMRMRIGSARACVALKTANDLPQYIKPHANEEFENFFIGHIKLVSDGSNQGLTGYQHKPYKCTPAGNYGNFNFPPDSHPLSLPEEYTEIVKVIAEKGWPLMIHANGDCALDFTLQAYETLPSDDRRHRVEHCSLLNEERLQKLSDMNISPSFLIGHVGYWGHVFDEAIFESKAHELDLCQSALKKGLRISLHSDCIVTPTGPLRMIEQAITRVMEGDPSKEVLSPHECLNVHEAFRALTTDAAWQCYSDEWVGSLESGKCADFVILSKDPFTMESFHGLRDLPVLETWLDGRKVFSK